MSLRRLVSLPRAAYSDSSEVSPLLEPQQLSASEKEPSQMVKAREETHSLGEI